MNFFKKLIIGIKRELLNNSFSIIFIAFIATMIVSGYISISSLKTKLEPIRINLKLEPILDSTNFSQSENEQYLKTINEFLEAVEKGRYGQAADMISPEGKSVFRNREEAIGYILKVFKGIEGNDLNTLKNYKYSVQPYAKVYDDRYIYSIKIFEDILSEGIAQGEDFNYLETKFVVFRENGKINLNIGGYILNDKAKGYYENNEVRLEVLDSDIWFSKIGYNIKVTNRTNYTLSLLDTGINTKGTIFATQDSEKRIVSGTGSINLGPKETRIITLEFPFFAESDKLFQSITFGNVRVINGYIQDINDLGLTEEEVQRINDKNTITKYQIIMPLE